MKTFSYQIDVQAIPVNSDTIKDCFGDDAVYNPDFPEDSLAREAIHEMIKDAISHVHELKCTFICQNKIVDTNNLQGREKDFWHHLESKVELYQNLEKTIKRIEA